jgi:hypothetical protein
MGGSTWAHRWLVRVGRAVFRVAAVPARRTLRESEHLLLRVLSREFAVIRHEDYPGEASGFGSDTFTLAS